MDSSSGNRFATLSDQDIKLLSEARHEKNTKKKLNSGVMYLVIGCQLGDKMPRNSIVRLMI